MYRCVVRDFNEMTFRIQRRNFFRPVSRAVPSRKIARDLIPEPIKIPLLSRPSSTEVNTRDTEFNKLILTTN